MPNAHLIISFESLYLHYFYYIFSFARIITRVYVMQSQRCGTYSDIFCLCVFLSCITSSFRKEWEILQFRYGFRLRQLSLNWSKDSKDVFKIFRINIYIQFSVIFIYTFIQHFGSIFFETFHICHFSK